jgi:hypothetical protein
VGVIPPLWPAIGVEKRFHLRKRVVPVSGVFGDQAGKSGPTRACAGAVYDRIVPIGVPRTHRITSWKYVRGLVWLSTALLVGQGLLRFPQVLGVAFGNVAADIFDGSQSIDLFGCDENVGSRNGR